MMDQEGKRPRGRPRGDNPQRNVVYSTVSAEEMDELRRAANHEGFHTFGEWVRSTLLKEARYVNRKNEGKS